MSICLVLGTRPEIIKMTPLVHELRARDLSFFVVHSGQHYDHEMDGIFLEELGWEGVDMVDLHSGSRSLASSVADIMVKLEELFSSRRPDVVLVLGDTNTAEAGALVATRMNIKVGHVEAGLRNFDRRISEEYSRVIIDHISDYLYAPTARSLQTLNDEGIGRRDIMHFDRTEKQHLLQTGNTVVDSLRLFKDQSDASPIFDTLNIDKGEYILFTSHRAENVDREEALAGIVEGMTRVQKELGVPVVFPIHPRTKKRLEAFGMIDALEKNEQIKRIDPVGFLTLVALESHAKIVLTDSGGIQEETCSLKVPCVVLRHRSDRPESVEAGASVLAGTDPDDILAATKTMLEKERNWEDPFGNGTAAKQIIDHLIQHI